MRVMNSFKPAEVELMFQALEGAAWPLRRRAAYESALRKLRRMRERVVKMRSDVASLEAARKGVANG